MTRKITRGIAAILSDRKDAVYLGNLESKRDWGYAPEYVEVMWRMLQQDAADDFVIGTGEAHSVREFAEAAFEYAGLDWRKHVKTSSRYLRPLEVQHLLADTRKARQRLDWEPRIHFADLVAIMVDADLEAAGLQPRGHGRAILEEKLGTWNSWHDSVTRVLSAAVGNATQ